MDWKHEKNSTAGAQLWKAFENIFDDGEFEDVRNRVEQHELVMTRSYLASSGIDAESFLNKARVRIRSTVPEVNVVTEDAPLSQEAFDSLDDEGLIRYLDSQGIDALSVVKNMKLRVDEHVGFMTVSNEQSFEGNQSFVQTAESNNKENSWGAFVSLIVSAVGGAKPLRPAVCASVLVGTLAVGIGIGVYGLSPVGHDKLTNATTQVSLSPSRSRSPLDVSGGRADYPETLGLGQIVALGNSERIEKTMPVMFTAARGIDAVNSSKTSEVGIATLDTAAHEFVFMPGDTLWDGMTKHGVPGSVQAKLTKKINIVFHPGDRVVFNVVNGDFNGLEIFLGQQDKITITKDLKLKATRISRTDIQTVVGKVEHSLHRSIASQLNDQAAWRVATRMKHLGVPVNKLQAGTGFEVRIERKTIPGGSVVGYGEIKSIRLDAGKYGKFVFDSEIVATQSSFNVLS